MTIRTDPEGNETRALFDIVNFSEQHVLEIGCGDGRLTWRYADKAAHVTAIDPSTEQIVLAREQLPDHLKDGIEFHNSNFENFSITSAPSTFDIVILSWAL